MVVDHQIDLASFLVAALGAVAAVGETRRTFCLCGKSIDISLKLDNVVQNYGISAEKQSKHLFENAIRGKLILYYFSRLSRSLLLI